MIGPMLNAPSLVETTAEEIIEELADFRTQDKPNPEYLRASTPLEKAHAELVKAKREKARPDRRSQGRQEKLEPIT